jgi:hypothetical protein
MKTYTLATALMFCTIAHVSSNNVSTEKITHPSIVQTIKNAFTKHIIPASLGALHGSAYSYTMIGFSQFFHKIGLVPYINSPSSTLPNACFKTLLEYAFIVPLSVFLTAIHAFTFSVSTSAYAAYTAPQTMAVNDALAESDEFAIPLFPSNIPFSSIIGALLAIAGHSAANNYCHTQLAAA